MLDIRVRLVLGRVQVSVWCNNHGGAAHCLWSGGAQAEGDMRGEVLGLVSDALRYLQRQADAGFVDLTDDCLT